jgi:hypothetical protein
MTCFQKNLPWKVWWPSERTIATRNEVRNFLNKPSKEGIGSSFGSDQLPSYDSQPPTCGLGNERWYEPSMLGTYLSLVLGLWIPVAVMMRDDGVIGAFQKPN